MHTSGIVITVSNDTHLATAALRELRAAGPFTLGDCVGSCWAATLEASDPQAAHVWHDWALELPGVESIEVVFVHWEEGEYAHA